MSERELLLTFSRSFSNVDMARAAIEGVCRGLFPEARTETSDFRLAVTEAMNNAVEHSVADRIEVRLLAHENEIVLRLCSKGERFDPTKDVSFPDLEGPESLPEGGFGRALIREMVDSWGYEYVDGINVLILRKKFS